MKKYSEIENSYRNKYIKKILERNPIYEFYTYSIQEKIDGANVSLIFYPYSDVFDIARRKDILKETEKFYNVFEIINRDEYKDLIKEGHRMAIESGEIVTFFGELHGKGIQNRFDYGPDKYFKIYDVHIGNLGYFPIYFIYESDVLKKYTVRLFALIKGLYKALDFTEELFLNDKIEGYVIKPYYAKFDADTSPFYLKKKIEKMSEKQNVKKKKEPVVYRQEVHDLSEMFSEYINKNRVLSVFSKEGEIEDPKQIGKYIGLVIEDAKKDFLKENEIDLSEFDKKEIGYALNKAKDVVKILNEFL